MKMVTKLEVIIATFLTLIILFIGIGTIAYLDVGYNIIEAVDNSVNSTLHLWGLIPQENAWDMEFSTTNVGIVWNTVRNW